MTTHIDVTSSYNRASVWTDRGVSFFYRYPKDTEYWLDPKGLQASPELVERLNEAYTEAANGGKI